MDIGATVNVPLFAAGELKGFFFLHYRMPRPFEGREIEFLREAAERVWSAINAARSKAALRASEARLAAAFESVPVGIAVLDNNGRVVVANTDYRRFLPRGVMPSCDPAESERWLAWSVDGTVLEPHNYPGALAVRGERTVPGQEMLFRVSEHEQLWTRVSPAAINRTGRQTMIAVRLH